MITGQPERLTVHSGVALTAGMGGALVLAAGLYEGHLAPRTVRRVDRRA